MSHRRPLLRNRCSALLLAVSSVALCTGTAINARVAVRAQADPAYTESRWRDPNAEIETYVFYPGRFFPGHVPDRTLEQTPFRVVAEQLAPHLAHQRYFPARSLAAADLVLVVHWGVTMGYDRASALFDYTLDSQRRSAELRETLADSLPGPLGTMPATENLNLAASARLQVNEAMSAAAGHDSATLQQAGRDLSVTTNSGLLGLNDLLHTASQSAVVTASSATMDAMLDEDRYFVVIMAYDRKALLEERLLRRRWSVRLSIRAPGRNFAGALAQLGHAGADVFGRQVDGLYFARPRGREARVDIGEVVVAGTEPEPAKRR